MAQVGYQTVYLWTCPDCGAVWQPRRRPRTGHDLVCVPHAEQRLVSRRETSTGARYCGSVNTSKGQREGIAPNVSL